MPVLPNGANVCILLRFKELGCNSSYWRAVGGSELWEEGRLPIIDYCRCLLPHPTNTIKMLSQSNAMHKIIRQRDTCFSDQESYSCPSDCWMTLYDCQWRRPSQDWMKFHAGHNCGLTRITPYQDNKQYTARRIFSWSRFPWNCSAFRKCKKFTIEFVNQHFSTLPELPLQIYSGEQIMERRHKWCFTHSLFSGQEIYFSSIHFCISKEVNIFCDTKLIFGVRRSDRKLMLSLHC